jgi:ubiquinone/menaquinone biosynthesis C-methylase UbiE
METESKQYLMENPAEAFRLEVKTDPQAIRAQAEWCGVRPGLRVLDVGCGSGKTASILHDMIGPDGELIGVDLSRDRIDYARRHFGPRQGLEFHVYDFSKPFHCLGKFDLIWVQFVLEYFRKEASDIVTTLTSLLKPDGYLCLLDLDYNCMTHYELTGGMQSVIESIVKKLEVDYNFDPFVGRKLYTYLYDNRYTDIEVTVMPHGLIFGNLKSNDQFNWTVKLKVASEKANGTFSEYPGGKDAFFDDFVKFLKDPRRFSYNPLIIAKGRYPGSEMR